MKYGFLAILLPFLLFACSIHVHNTLQAPISVGKNIVDSAQLANSLYLKPIIASLQKKWPHNPMVNLVFHGHSVPAGYFQTPTVNTFQSYPLLVLKRLTDHFPTAQINCIRTAIGGENSEQGIKRFDSTVLNHKPDVLFIDYALNDRSIGLARSKAAMEHMIQKALLRNIKVVLLTPTPDLKENILSEQSELEKFSIQIIELVNKYKIGLIDSYQGFKNLAEEGQSLENFMAQNNHPNHKGHQLVADEISKLFGLK
jgi:acyl-CoA thioesterase I